MLPRSFKAAKCKTSLKIAVSRLKLLKNKGEIQIKHMKKDLAQLLETGQDQAARIRVEHVVREEKTMAAYEIIELYCELIVARFAIIESQKNCPIDLKEAVSSVIFASGRCADVPELQDVRKQFTAKYGKDFVSSVLELRPDCGVSRTIIEKLSAKTPDGATKFKILTAIAREHNVKWEPEASADQVSEPAEDLLDGPSKFVSASKIPVESPNVRFQATNVQFQAPNDQSQAPNVQFQAPNVQSQAPVHFKSVNEQFLVPPSQKHDSYSKLSENDVIKSSPSFDTFSSANPSKHTTAMPSNSHPESRASENNIGGREYRPPMTDNEKGSFNRQNWSMKFKDATSAAQAAAESAEMASLAARAAAELSKRGHVASFYEPRDEGPMDPNGSDPKGGIGENSWKTGNDPLRNFYGMNSREQSQQRDGLQQDQAREGAESKYEPRDAAELSKRGHEASFYKPRDEGPMGPNGLDPKGGIGENSWKTGNDPSKNFYGMNSREQSQQRDELQQDQARGGAESKYDGLGGITRRSSRSDSSQPSITSTNDEISVTNYQKTEKFSQKNSSKADVVVPDYQRNDTQSSSPSSFSYSGMIHTDANADSAPTTQKYEAEAFEQCEVDIGQEMSERITKQPSLSDYPVAVFDESSSESEDQLDLGSDSFRTHERNSLSSISSNVHPWSPKQQKSKSLQKNSFSEQLFEREIPPSVEFSEGSAKDSVAFQPEDLMPAAFDDSDGLSSESEKEMNNLKIREISEGSSLPRKKDVSIRSSFAARASPELLKASPRKIDEAEGMKNSTFFYSSSDDSGSDVRHLPNVSSPKPLTDKEVRTEDSLREPPSPDGNNDLEFSKHSYNVNEPELNFGRLTGGLRNKGFTRPPYVKHPSRQETANETQTITERTPVSVSKKPSPSYKAHAMESSNQKQFIKAKKGSNSRSQFTYFDSDSDEAEVKPRKTVVTKSDRSGFSLRTRNSPPTSEMDSRFASEYGPPIRSDSGDGSKASQLGWSSKPQIETEKSTNRNNSKSSGSRSSVSQPSEPLPQTDIMSLKVEESSKPLQQTAKRGSTESPKSRSLSEESKLRESSRKSASHFPITANPVSSESPKSASLSGGSTLRENSLRSVSHFPKSAERLRESSLKSADDMPKTAEPLRESSLKSARHLPKTAERLRESSLRSADDMPKTAEPLRERALKSAGHLPKTAERLKESSFKSAGHLPKTAEPGSSESPKSPDLSVASTSRESSLKSASHVHPKLPDYDSFAAHFESLRTNRR